MALTGERKCKRVVKFKALRPLRRLVRRKARFLYRRVLRPVLLSGVLRYLVPCLLTCAILSPSVAFAVDTSTEYNGSFRLGYTNKSGAYTSSMGEQTAPLPYQSKTYTNYASGESGVTLSNFSAKLANKSAYNTGSIGLYVSFYFYSNDNSATTTWKTIGQPKLIGYFNNENGYQTQTGTDVSYSTFIPQSSLPASTGYTVKVNFNATDANPATGIGFNVDSVSNKWGFVSNHTLTTKGTGIYITSARVVTAESSADLAALESMASAIASQNDILSAMYGDILTVCNQMYARLGDIQAAQEASNAYFQTVITTLNAVNTKLRTLNTTTTNIYELLQEQFALLLAQIQTSTTDITTTINEAELRLENYLKPVIDYITELQTQTGESASSLPGHKQDVNNNTPTGSGLDTDTVAGLATIATVLGSFSYVITALAIWFGCMIVFIVVKKGLS